MTDAKKTGRSKSYYAREAILRQIEDIDDYYLACRRLAREGSRVTLETLGAAAQETHKAVTTTPVRRIEFDRAAA
jgi:RHH-type rel operon transcriptional repressor/antitoxin RelB